MQFLVHGANLLELNGTIVWKCFSLSCYKFRQAEVYANVVSAFWGPFWFIDYELTKGISHARGNFVRYSFCRNIKAKFAFDCILKNKSFGYKWFVKWTISKSNENK